MKLLISGDDVLRLTSRWSKTKFKNVTEAVTFMCFSRMLHES